MPEKKKKIAASTEDLEEDTPMLEAVTKKKAQDVDATRIKRLKIQRGCLLLCSVLEITQYYIIVNYSRNKKGYISSSDIPIFNIFIIELSRLY